MIRNDSEVQTALEWIAYWKSTRSVGQSWLGNEQAARTIAELRRDIDEYHRRATLLPDEPASRNPSPGDQISKQPV